QYLYTAKPSCVEVDANVKNSCAYNLDISGQSPWTGASTTASNILTKMAEGAGSLSSHNSTLTTVLSAYSTKLCGGGKVKACVLDIGAGADDNLVFRAIHDDKHQGFIRKLKDERSSSGFSTLITSAVNVANGYANTKNSAFLASVGTDFLNSNGTDLKNLGKHLAYCSSDLLNSKVKSGSSLSAAALINVLKDDPAFTIGCGGEGAFTNKLACQSKKRIFPKHGILFWEQSWRTRQCPAGGKTNLEDNQSDLVDANSQMFTTLQTCVGADTLDKVQITASSNLLNNTASAAAAHCKKGFSALSKARAASVKTVAKQKFGLQDGQFPDPPGPSTGGTNGDGTSGPCPYEIDAAKSSNVVFFEKAVAQRPDLKDYKYVKAVGTIVPTTNDRGRGSDNLTATRPCRAISLACEWAELKCPSDGTRF
ncbi:MAG: hypothetical protein HYW49_13305, partial [Deltaproteobacteria bacterium]|nr:hypothetical protein [Deltaproteobacteria bacterium]